MHTNTITIQNSQSRNTTTHTPTMPTQGQFQAWTAEPGKSDGPRLPKVEERNLIFRAKGCETQSIRIGLDHGYIPPHWVYPRSSEESYD